MESCIYCGDYVEVGPTACQHHCLNCCDCCEYDECDYADEQLGVERDEMRGKAV